MSKLRVGTWNIKGGRGRKGCPIMFSKLNLNRMAKEIYEAGLHIVLLQEVDMKNLRCLWLEQPRYLAEKLEAYTSAKWYYLFAQAFPLLGGSYGNAVLSAYPLEEVLNLSLKLPGQKVEERVFLFAHFFPSGLDPLGIGTFHLSVIGESQRVPEAKKIKAALGKLFPLPPLILGGDLNGKRGSAAFQKLTTANFPLEELGPRDGDSFTAPDCRARIDFLFGKEVNPCASGIIDAGESSDHHLVWVECDI
jgi:endonuclease/exonuclease/phosphatase family metal-dependent hydrolase